MTKRAHPVDRTKDALDEWVADFERRGYLLFQQRASARPALCNFRNIRALCRQIARYEKRPFVWAMYRETPQYSWVLNPDGLGGTHVLRGHSFYGQVSATEHVALAPLSAPLHLFGVTCYKVPEVVEHDGVYTIGTMQPGCYDFAGDRGRQFFWTLMKTWDTPEMRALMMQRVVPPKRYPPAPKPVIFDL